MNLDEMLLGGLISNRCNEREVAQAVEANLIAFGKVEGWRHLQDENAAALAEMAVAYHGQTGDHIDIDVATNIFRARALSTERAHQLTCLFSKVAGMHVEQRKFNYWLSQAVEVDKAAMLTTALTRASQVLSGKAADSDGICYSGFQDAVTLLQEEISQILGTSGTAAMPSGNIRDELQEILLAVAKAEAGDMGEVLIPTGQEFIDSVVGGMARTDFTLVGAFTGEGKSQMCANIGWHTTVHGYNTMIITAETQRTKYRMRMITRHTHAPGVGLMSGIPYNNIKFGKWDSEEQRAAFVRVAEDWAHNTTYGVCDITQVTQGSTIADIYQAARDYQRRYGKELDVLIVDYLTLLSAKGSSERERINSILKAAKELALTFNNGKGVALVSAHQMKGEVRAVVKPENGKFYTIGDFADTSEAGKSADLAVALLRTDELASVHELAASILKVRDADRPMSVVRLYEDFATSYIGNLAAAG